jgi:small conductance mechanosensitive channel
MLKGLLAGLPLWVATTIAVSVALALAYLAAEVASRLLGAVFVRAARSGGDRTTPAPQARPPVRTLRLTVFALVSLVLLFPALKVAGLDPRVGFEPEAVAGWLLASGVRIVVIGLLAVLVIRATGTAVSRFQEEAARGEGLDAIERGKRVRTLGTLIENTVGVVTVAVAVLMVLRELRVDVVPLLTGAGIVGLAVGFGAQSLVKDVISGFFIILENQVRVGDVAVINGTGGAVESIKLRTITLRDVEGTVHVFPNGSITTLANRSKDYSYAVIDVSVGYREDTDRVVEVLRGVGEGLRRDAAFEASLLGPLEVFGVEALADWAVTIKIRVKTLPLKQWEIARELRRRIKKTFDAEGIEIPFPRQLMQMVDAGPLPGRTPDPHAADES